MPEPVSRPSRADTTEGRAEARQVCASSGCTEPVSRRRVILLDPDGRDRNRCGPYCATDTDRILKNLFPRYTGGGPAYRIEETDHV